jgi:aspartate/methionine/tyrosine aminotransferase
MNQPQPTDSIRPPKPHHRQFLAEIPGGLGAYSDSAGAAVVRRLIAGAIERRDGVPCDPSELYMTVRGLLFTACWVVLSYVCCLV